MGRDSLSTFTAMARRGADLCSVSRTEPLRGIRDARRLKPPTRSRTVVNPREPSSQPLRRVRLKEHYRLCFILREIEGRAYEDIAEILDLPVGTVSTCLTRARSELLAALTPSATPCGPPPAPPPEPAAPAVTQRPASRSTRGPSSDFSRRFHLRYDEPATRLSA
jgi:hypothetical protein